MEFDVLGKEIRDNTYISNVYKSISKYNIKGHKIGRKIGDMLEILTMGIIYQNKDLKRCLKVEQKLEGYTTAGHKVEFGFYGPNDQLFGAIECKCVGVEETVDGQNNKHLKKLTIGGSYDFPMSFQGGDSKTVTIVLERIKDANIAELKISDGFMTDKILVKMNDTFNIAQDENSKVFVGTPTKKLIDVVPTLIRKLKNVKVTKIDDGSVTLGFYNCLTGPQTIEKAKQASFVSMDLHKKIDGYWGIEEILPQNKKFTFILVLCEFSHWEQKSRNVITTCNDYNLLIPDQIIIEAFDEFEEEFGAKDMLQKISKKVFETDSKVRDVVFSILDKFDNKVLYDIKAKEYVSLGYSHNRLLVLPQS